VKASPLPPTQGKGKQMINVNEMITKYNLVELQNHDNNVEQDHLSFCSLFKTEAQFEALAAKLIKRSKR
jgi:hypothetical protein